MRRYDRRIPPDEHCGSSDLVRLYAVVDPARHLVVVPPQGEEERRHRVTVVGATDGRVEGRQLGRGDLSSTMRWTPLRKRSGRAEPKGIVPPLAQQLPHSCCPAAMSATTPSRMRP